MSAAVRSTIPGCTEQPLVPRVGGLGLTTGNTTKGSRFGPSDSIGSSEITVVAVIVLDGNISGATGIFSNWSNTSATNFVHIGQTGANSMRLQVTRGGTGSFVDTTVSVPGGAPCVAVAVINAASASFYVNNLLVGSFATGTGPITGAGQFWQSGNYYTNDSVRNSNSTLLASAVLPGAASSARVAEISANPWQVFYDQGEEDEQALYVQSTSGITGTLASTEGSDTLSASGSVLIGGTLAKTEGADTLSAAGSVLVSGTLAATEGADTLASSGTVGNAIMGTLAVTEGSDTAAGSGSVLVSGTLACTEGADTLAAAGNVIPSAITGTLAVTEGADTLVATNIVAQPGGGDGGGAGPVREVRAYARQFDRLNKPTRAQKKRRRLELVEEALELLPDNEAAEQAAPIIAGIVFNREASAIDRYGKAITFDAETALRAQVAAWIQQRAAEDAEEEEIALQLLLMG